MNKVNNSRQSPLRLDAEQFRKIGYQLVDELCARMKHSHKVLARPKLEDDAFRYTHSAGEIPQRGTDAAEVFTRFTRLLIDQSVSISHPRFFAYIMGAGSEVSALADFLASAINPPLTSSSTSPLSTMIEAQTIQWMAQLLGFKAPCGGLFVSGGSIANLVAVKAALHSKVGFDSARAGVKNLHQYRIYVSLRTHSSIVAAANICGFGQRGITYVETTADHKLSLADLNLKITEDQANGFIPLMVVGIAGCTSLGIIDPLNEMAELCRQREIWFHVDAAYGGLAILAPQAPADLNGLRVADSITIDPHKWMYAAADVGCILTKSKDVLINTFSQDGAYYSTDSLSDAASLQFRDLGPQTTRSFRALKVRMSLEIAGQQGYRKMISEDIDLAVYLHQLATEHEYIEACTCHLSITTLRFVPPDFLAGGALDNDQLNQLNQALLAQLQSQGESFPSHTWHEGKYLIRVCIVNLNTNLLDINRLFDNIVAVGVSCNELLFSGDGDIAGIT